MLKPVVFVRTKQASLSDNTALRFAAFKVTMASLSSGLDLQDFDQQRQDVDIEPTILTILSVMAVTLPSMIWWQLPGFV